ncbi:hypothetical protein PM082_001920 [Marasmius tenuissimus]|nr:hypothetical protein PM082_001920 [Marasmius tenuissimus]
MSCQDPKDVYTVVHFSRESRCLLALDAQNEKRYKLFTWAHVDLSVPPPYIRPQNTISTENPDSIFGAKKLHWFDPNRPYLPLIPRYEIVLRQHPAFNALAHQYGRFPTTEVSLGRYRLDEKLASSWDTLERWLKNMIKQLILLGDPPSSLVPKTFQTWPYPARSRYLTFEGTPASVQRMAARTKNSFLPLIATCSMLLFWCQRRFEKTNEEGIAFEWLKLLKTENDPSEQTQRQHRTWISELLHSFVGDPDTLRVGTILDGTKEDCADWLSHLKHVNMPIYIYWGYLDKLSGSPLASPDADYRHWAVRSDESYRQLYRLAPRNSDIVNLSERVASGFFAPPKPCQISLVSPDTDTEVMAIPLQSGSGQQPGERVEAYFLRQREYQKGLILNESVSHREQRWEHERDNERKPQPGKNGPRIWYWEMAEHEFRVRTLLTRAEGNDCWSKHGFDQKRYNSFQNCWDICSDWGGYDDDTDDDDHGDDPEDIAMSAAGSITIEDSTIVTPEEVLDRLILTDDGKDEVNIDLKDSIRDIAWQVYGFTGEAFSVPQPLNVQWNITQEALGNGRWLGNELNASFKEDEPDELIKEQLQGFLQNILNHPTPLPWTIPSIVPSLDIHSPGAYVLSKEAWKFGVSAWNLEDGRYYHLQWQDTSTSILVQDPVTILRLVRTKSGTEYTDAAAFLYREGVKFHTLAQGPLINRDVDFSGGTDDNAGRKTFKGPRLGYISERHPADAYDFYTYESARNRFLRGEKGRAAALAGGLMSRIAKEVVTEEDVVHGPEVPNVFYRGKCFFEDSGIGYWDDYLTEEEVDLICGVYYFATGKSFILYHWYFVPMTYRPCTGLRG